MLFYLLFMEVRYIQNANVYEYIANISFTSYLIKQTDKQTTNCL